MEKLFIVLSLVVLMLFGFSAHASPPACQAEISVTTPVPQSNDTIFACINMQLQFEDVSLLEGALSVRTWNFGDGSGAVDGLLSSVTSYAYPVEGIYTMSLTVNSLLCTEMTVTKTVVVLGMPEYTVASLDVLCAGDCNGKASVAVVSPTQAFYHFEWNDGLVQQNDTAFNLCAGLYQAIIQDDYGCTDMMTSPVEVFEPQLLTVVIDLGDTVELCPANGTLGVSLTIEGGAGNNQSVWTTSSAVTVLSPELMNFEPNELSLNQTYNVVVMDNNGCSASDSIHMEATPSSLHGTVAMQGTPCENCEVIRYHFEAENGVWLVIESVFTDASGAYDFGAVENFEKFVLMADPEDVAHPMGVETFYPQKHQWVDATVFQMCGDDYDKHIALIPPMNFNGDNTLSGTVYYSASGKTQTEEDPIPLIDVVVEKTPPGQAQGRVATNGNGGYEFTYVPSSDTAYTLFVNLPGVPVISTYEILADGNSTYPNLDFCLNIDSTEIHTCQVEDPLVTGEDDTEGERIGVYPNPNSGMFTIETGAFAAAAAELSIIDQLGRVVFRKSYAETPYTVNMVNLAQGFYVVQITNNTKAESAPVSVLRN